MSVNVSSRIVSSSRSSSSRRSSSKAIDEDIYRVKGEIDVLQLFIKKKTIKIHKSV